MSPRNILDHVFVNQKLVGHGQHVLKSQVDFTLTCGCNFMVVTFHFQAAVHEGLHHLISNIHHVVGGRNRKIALFVPDLIAPIGAFITTAIPLPFDAVEVVKP